MHTNIDSTTQAPGLEECVEAATEKVNTAPQAIIGENSCTTSEAAVNTGILKEDDYVIDQVGQLTRNLHDSLRELGFDKRIESLSSEVPVTKDNLTYVATKIEEAAICALNATETAMPIQDKLATNATKLSEKWKEILESKPATSTDFKELLIKTLSYLDDVPNQTSATNAQLMDIMMAQDFQDLTGQVIKKIAVMVQTLEKELVQLLLANKASDASEQKTKEAGFLNGPVTNSEKYTDIVSNQDQVDDLLARLGF